MKEIQLTKLQKDFVLREFESNPDLLFLTRKCFNNDKLDGRDKEGRAIRKFLLEQNKNFGTTKRKRAESVELSEDDKENVMKLAENHTKPMDICKIIFPDRKITPLNNEFKVIYAYIQSKNPELLLRDDDNGEYRPPSTTKQLIAKIYEITGKQYDEDKLTKFDQEKFELLKNYLKSPRYNEIMNRVYRKKEDRKIIEYELMKTCWDKLDLNSDELNACISLAILYLNQIQIEQRIEHLNGMMDDVTEDGEGKDITLRLVEAIRTKNDEKTECVKQQSQIQKSLNQSRGERLKQQKDSNASILSLVKAFQQEDERNNMIRMAELESRAVEDEADRLESLNEWKVRVMGINRGDAI